MKLRGECDNIVLSIILRKGVCHRSVNKEDAKFEECYDWNDEDAWRDIDKIANTHAYAAVKNHYAFVTAFTALGLVIMFFQVVACVLAIKYSLRTKRLSQRFVVAASTFYLLLIGGSATLGSNTPLTDWHTWAAVYDCDASSDNISYPDTGYLLSLTIAQLQIALILFLVLCPGQCCCLHLVQYAVRGSSQSVRLSDMRSSHTVHYATQENTKRPSDALTEQLMGTDTPPMEEEAVEPDDCAYNRYM